MAGWEKAKRDTVPSKKDLDVVLQQKAASDERISQLEAALKEYVEQLHFVRQEQERRVHGAVIKASEEFDKRRIALNEKLAEAGKHIARLDAENSQLQKSLASKEKAVEELSRYRTQVEADLTSLVMRVESSEKDRASLSYEVRVLEKELDIRNEEMEFNRRAADIAQKQHQDSVKKISKLESECLRLRLLVRRRLPGPAALTEMKNEVEMLGTRRRRSNPPVTEQNRSLQYSFDSRSNQSQFRRNDYVRAASRPSHAKKEHSLAALSDLGSDDCAESWASALISDLEISGTTSNGYMGTTEMNLMDDFAEMEKLAVVSLDYPATSSHNSSEEGNASSGGQLLPTIDREKVPKTLTTGQESRSESPWQLDDLLKMLLEYSRALKISPNEVLEDMKVAFIEQEKNHLDASKAENGNDISTQNNGGAASFLGKDDKCLPDKSLATPTGYVVRVFQWKSAEISEILQQFLKTCNDLLNGKANLEQFVHLVASCLDWIMSHCFSFQDVLNMKEAMRSRLEWDESRSESEFDSGSANHSAESNRLNIQRGSANNLIVEPTNTDLSTIDFGGKAQSQTFIAESFKNQPVKETMVQSIGNAGDQIESWKMMQEELETQFIEGYHEQRKILPLKNDLENTSNPFERQDETCNDQESQPRSKRSNEGQDDGQFCGKQLRDDWEITAASEKLAECQETILNLGKQLKALASPKDAAVFDISTPADKMITSTPTPTRTVSKRLSLRDNMLAEDSDHIGTYPIITEDIQTENSNSTVSALNSWSKCTESNGIKGKADTKATVSMAIVPRKKKEGKSFLKKLFLWQKKGDRKKALFS